MQRRTASQPGSALHAHITAHNGHIAVVALVPGVGLRDEWRWPLQFGVDQSFGQGDAQIVPPDLTGPIPSIQCEQARLEGQQAQCVARGRAAMRGAAPMAIVSVQCGRRIQAEHGGLSPVHGAEPIGDQTAGAGACADAQQGIDRQVP